MVDAVRSRLQQKISEQTDNIIAMCSRMVRIPSEVPLSDTRAIVDEVVNMVSGVDGIDIERHCQEEPVHNLVLRIKGKRPGKRLVFNGHLDTVPHARGDAMLNSDVGSPMVLRCGEKGMIWIDIKAEGVASHAAHVHRGINAIERLTSAMDAIKIVRQLPVPTPYEVERAIVASKPVSEPLCGDGEAEVLRQVTLNFGIIEGGLTSNLVAASASVGCDIRIPMGITVQQLEQQLGEILDPLEGVSYDITRRYEATWTSPEHAMFQLAADHLETSIGTRPAINMRVGASDARLYRMYDIPTLVAGPTPYGLGGPDEHVLIDDLKHIAYTHVMTAFDYLQS